MTCVKGRNKEVNFDVLNVVLCDDDTECPITINFFFRMILLFFQSKHF